VIAFENVVDFVFFLNIIRGIGGILIKLNSKMLKIAAREAA